MPKYKHLVEQNRNMVRRLVKFCHLDEDLVQNIVRFAKCLVKPDTGLIDFQIFFLVMSTYFRLMDEASVMRMFSRLSLHHPEQQLSVEDFSKVLCIFNADDLDIKIDYVFRMYDNNGDGCIDNREVANLIRACKCFTDTDDSDKDETFLDLCVMATEILGLTGDGITLEDFRRKVKENNLILFILGQMLPPYDAVEKFRQKIVGKTNIQMKETFGQIRFELLFELTKDAKGYYPILLDIP